MRRALVLLAVAAALATPGCFQPYRVHVADAVMANSGWVAVGGNATGSTWVKTKEVAYEHDGAANGGPPYPGLLQVFSVRAFTRLGEDELLDRVEQRIAEGAQADHIALDAGREEGHRTIANGVKTSWIVRTGHTTTAGGLFGDEVAVRILAEYGHDGRSDTSFVAVARVQVNHRTCAFGGSFCNDNPNLVSWVQVVGDAEGSIGGATSQTGFIDHLVTR